MGGNDFVATCQDDDCQRNLSQVYTHCFFVEDLLRVVFCSMRKLLMHVFFLCVFHVSDVFFKYSRLLFFTENACIFIPCIGCRLSKHCFIK